jgi:hypothetical protein
MAKTRSRRSTWLDQGKAASLVRYGPEISALMALRQENVTDYHRALHQADAGRMGTQAAVAAAIPALQKIYAADEATRRGIATVPNTDLAALGPAANAFKAAQVQELGGALGALTQTRTQALSDLTSRGVRAAESAAGARGSALAQYRADQGKVNQRHLDLLGEMGAFTQQTAGDLSQKAAQRRVTRLNTKDRIAQSERSSVRSSGIDPDTGKPIPGGKLDPRSQANASKAFKSKYGVDLASPDAHRSLIKSVSTEMDRVGDLVKQAKKDRRPRSETDRVLRTGITGGTVHDPATGRVKVDPKTGLAVTAPDVKPVDSLERGIILDLIYDGHVSDKHANALHNQGYSVSRLGLPGATAKQRRQAAQRRKLDPLTDALIKVIS